MIVSLTYPPSVNRAWRMANGRMIQSPEVKHWKTAAAWAAKAAGAVVLDGTVRLDAILHPRQTKRGAASKTRLDLDNCLKLAVDAMNGIAYGDDKQIVEISARIGTPKAGGGLTVRVTSVGPDIFAPF